MCALAFGVCVYQCDAYINEMSETHADKQINWIFAWLLFLLFYLFFFWYLSSCGWERTAFKMTSNFQIICVKGRVEHQIARKKIINDLSFIAVSMLSSSSSLWWASLFGQRETAFRFTTCLGNAFWTLNHPFAFIISKISFPKQSNFVRNFNKFHQKHKSTGTDKIF